MKITIRIILIILSIGWVLPAWFGLDCLHVALTQTDETIIANSFPYLHESKNFTEIAIIWLALVFLFWSWVLSKVFLKK